MLFVVSNVLTFRHLRAFSTTNQVFGGLHAAEPFCFPQTFARVSTQRRAFTSLRTQVTHNLQIFCQNMVIKSSSVCHLILG